MIEELATSTLTKRMGTKFIANFTQLMGRAFGRKKDVAKTPERKPSSIKQELKSPGAPGQELEGEYEGSIPEGKFISAANHVRAYVKGVADKLRTLWKGVTDRQNQPFIPRSTDDLSLASK